MIRSGMLLGLVALLSGVATAAQYALVDNYDNSNFFEGFDFFNAADPTHGFVQYTSAQTANSQGLAGYVNDMVYLGVDYKTQDPTTGRASTRVSSKKTYTGGLFVADIAHMPVGCGVWPAFWTFGPNWPSSGEIDIIEGVNSATTNAVTLHTSEGCSMSNAGSLASSKFANGNTDCGAGNGDDGCSQQTVNTQGYGTGFNAIGGGVYAMEWTSEAISVWFFPRGSALASTLAANSSATAPDPTTFGTPVARFSGGGCNIGQRFANHQIILNIALCGDWAGKVWSEDATCSALASSCQAYVSQDASAFTDAYWLVNSIKVYQQQQPQKARRGELRVRRFIA